MNRIMGCSTVACVIALSISLMVLPGTAKAECRQPNVPGLYPSGMCVVKCYVPNFAIGVCEPGFCKNPIDAEEKLELCNYLDLIR